MPFRQIGKIDPTRIHVNVCCNNRGNYYVLTDVHYLYFVSVQWLQYNANKMLILKENNGHFFLEQKSASLAFVTIYF